MKILHVINTVNPTAGGPIEGIKQIARQVTQHSAHSVEIASADAPGAEFVRSSSIPVHACGPGMLRYQYAPRLTDWIRENHSKFDAVIVNGLWGYAGRATRTALLGTRTPYFVFTHGMLDPWFKQAYPLKHFKKTIYWSLSERMLLRDAKAVLFTCEEERLLARESFRRYSATECVISYGTAAPDGDCISQRALFLEKHPECRGKRLVLQIGRIHPKKGLDLSIRAFAQVFEDDPSWQLVIAGPDQVGLKVKLVDLAERLAVGSRITWTGMLQGDLKWGAIRSAEVHLLPSHQENFGIVVAEALACGVPALLSKKVNIWREVEQDGAGIVDVDTVDGACKVLRSWLAMTPSQQQHMREEARRSFAKRFEVSRTAHDLVCVLKGKAEGLNLTRYSRN